MKKKNPNFEDVWRVLPAVPAHPWCWQEILAVGNRGCQYPSPAPGSGSRPACRGGWAREVLTPRLPPFLSLLAVCRGCGSRQIRGLPRAPSLSTVAQQRVAQLEHFPRTPRKPAALGRLRLRGWPLPAAGARWFPQVPAAAAAPSAGPRGPSSPGSWPPIALPRVAAVPVDGVAVSDGLGARVLAEHTHPEHQKHQRQHLHVQHHAWPAAEPRTCHSGETAGIRREGGKKRARERESRSQINMNK